MNQKIYVATKLSVCLLAIITLLLLGFKSGFKQNDDIVLKDEHLDLVPKGFYIADVVDDRDDRSAIAWLLTNAFKTGNQQKTHSVDFRGGGLAAIKQFIAHNLPLNKTLLPVIIHLKKFKVIETALASGRAEGHVSVVMSFDVDKGEEEVVHLADYNGSAVYMRSAGPAQDVEPTLRRLIENGLGYINTWMERQEGSNIKLATSVKVSFTDFEEKPEGDTIYYNINRPLTWQDFQSKTASKKYDAEVFPSIGYDEQAKVTGGIVNINLAIKVSMPKSASWVKEGGKNDYTLNHEQRHFDIAKLVGEHFKQKIKTDNLQVNNFDGTINVEYLDAYREMDNLQKQYDDETRHGLNQAEQQFWDKKIDKELKIYGLKK